MSSVRLTKEAGLEIYPTPTNLHISTVNDITFLFWDSPNGEKYSYDVECRRAQDNYFRSFSWGSSNRQRFGYEESFSIEPNTNYYFRVRVSDFERNGSEEDPRHFYSPFSEQVFYDYTKTYSAEPNVLTKADYELILSCIDKAANAEKDAEDAAYQSYLSSSSTWLYYALSAQNHLETERKALAQIITKLQNHPELEELSTVVYHLYLVTNQYTLITPNTSTYKRYTAEIVALAAEKIDQYREALGILNRSSSYFILYL